MNISIIIPCFNEVLTIEKVVANVKSYVKNYDYEIIIIDDGSTDGTREILNNNLDRSNIKVYLNDKNYGKGFSVRKGIDVSTKDIILIQDADLEYDPSDYKFLIEKISNENLKVVYGSRVLKSQNNQKIQNFSHKIRIYGNYFLTKISNLINKQKLTDAHTCYKMFETNLFKSIKLEEDDFSFCPEITTKISLLNVTVKEVPINYIGRSYEDGKKIVALDALKAILTIIKYRYFK